MINLKTPSPALKRATYASVVALSAALVLAGWLAGSPHGSSPDDNFHLASIWCAAGPEAGVCADDAPSSVRIPAAITGEACYARRASTDASCQQEQFDARDTTLGEPTRSNVHRSRPNLYYRVMHVFVGNDLVRSIGLMRTANALLTMALFAATFWLGRGSIRQALAGSWLVASVPLGLFLMTSTSTNAWAIAGAGTFWAALLTAVESADPRRRYAASALAAIAAVVAIGSRYESVLYLALAAIAVALVATKADPRAIVRNRRGVAIGAGAAAITAVVIALTPAASGNLTQAIAGISDGFARLHARDVGNAFLYNTVELPLIWTGIFGFRGGRGSLGWLDTTMPPLVFVPMLCVFGALVFVGLSATNRAKVVNVSLIAGTLIVMPWTWFAARGFLMQEYIQPRHFMGLFYILVAFALLNYLGQRLIELTRFQRLIVVASTSVAHAVALHANIRRYVSGWDGNWRLRLNTDAEWWWHSLPSPMTIWLIASLAFVVVAYAAMRQFAPREATSDVEHTAT